MKRKNTTRSALFTSIISLLLCVSMLVGTTFAWFTDEVQSGRNVIAAGNLDVELYHTDEDESDVKVDGSTKLFNDVVLWEPGAVLFDTLQVKNVGTLALKYDLELAVLNETVVNGYKLSDVIKVGVIDGALGTGTTRDGLIAAVSNWTTLKDFSMNKNGIELEVGGEDTFTLVLYWQPNSNEIDNRYNMNNENQSKILQLDIGVNLFATQVEEESDSFGDDYDANAPTLITVNGAVYDTVAEAQAALNSVTGAVTLAMNNVDYAAESGHALTIPANVTATLDVQGYVSLTGAAGGAGIWVSEGSSLTITGDTLIAKGNAGVDDEQGGSGIGGLGNITVDGVKALTAEGYGKNGYGIGSATSTVAIKNSTVVMARGGYYNAEFTDTKYVKDAKAGAPAIGGATITITDSTVRNTLGGSKAAGIGARFWNSTTITISGSTIENVEGGASAAGIGGSRLAENVSTAPVTIIINDSTITAKGGYYGAGIGSGYDTHCSTTQSMHTISITGNSVINAQGGKYAAGIGTGYHVAALNLSIEDTVTTNAKSGEKFYKAAYTLAQDVGYGVVDPTREGTQANIPATKTYYITNAEQLIALGNTSVEGTIYLANDIDLGGASIQSIGAAYGKTLTVEGNGYAISNGKLAAGKHNGMDTYGLFYAYTNSTLTIKDLKINNVNVDATKDATRNYGSAVVVGYADGGSNVTLNNVDVTNCSVLNNTVDIGDEAGVYVGYQTGTLTMKDCDSTGCAVAGETEEKTGAFIGMVNGNSSLTNCTTDLTIGACNRIGSSATLLIDGKAHTLPTNVTPENISSVDFKKDGTYKFSGDFNGANILVQSVAGKNIVLDGTNATNVGELIVNANANIVDHWNTANGVDADRTGSYTVQHFNAKQISAFAYDTTLTITDNTVEFIGMYGANVALDINKNTVDANFAKHSMSSPGNTASAYASSEYAVYLAMANYDLKFDNNTVTDAYSHAVGINGLQTQFKETTFTTNNVASFSGNNITVNSTEKTNRAALKMWDDTIYAPNTSSTAQVDAAKTLQNTIKNSNNTFTLGEGHIYFEFYEVAVGTL